MEASYKALVNIRHNGRLFAPGEALALEDEDAERLLINGRIEPVAAKPARKAKAKAKAKAKTEAS